MNEPSRRRAPKYMSEPSLGRAPYGESELIRKRAPIKGIEPADRAHQGQRASRTTSEHRAVRSSQCWLRAPRSQSKPENVREPKRWSEPFLVESTESGE